MNLSSNTPHKKARIEIIPLIDIMFFLLASFMLVSMSMIKLQKIETKLPSKRTAPPTDADKHDFVVIGVDAKSNIYFDKDKDPINADQIPAASPALLRPLQGRYSGVHQLRLCRLLRWFGEGARFGPHPRHC